VGSSTIFRSFRFSDRQRIDRHDFKPDTAAMREARLAKI
jgi:hypothetical protein